MLPLLCPRLAPDMPSKPTKVGTMGVQHNKLGRTPIAAAVPPTAAPRTRITRRTA